MAQLISQITLAFLTLAALAFVLQLARQKRAGQLSPSSFSTVLLVVLTGWILTEVVSDATGASLGQWEQVTHFAVMILFAVTLTWQLRRSWVT